MIEPIPEVLSLQLASVPDRTLFDEVRRRGYVALPQGAWEGMCEQYQAEIDDFRAREEAEAGKRALMVDARPVLQELGHLASVDLPETARFAGRLLSENAELSARARRAEFEASALAAAVVREELPETRYESDYNEDMNDD